MIGKSQVYFARPVGMLAPIKIGVSGNPKGRLGALSTWSPFPLEIAAQVPGDRRLEMALHSRFAHVHSHREWFLADRDLVLGIEKIGRGMAIEEAFDLNLRIGQIRYNITGKKNLSAAWRQRMSYNHKVRWAIKKAQSFHVARRWAPEAVYNILNTDHRDILLTSNEVAVIEDFLSDPINKCAIRYHMSDPVIIHAEGQPS